MGLRVYPPGQALVVRHTTHDGQHVAWVDAQVVGVGAAPGEHRLRPLASNHELALTLHPWNHAPRELPQAAFDQLGVARRFGFLGEMRLFSGFFVSRRSTLKSHFHTDFSDTDGSAFTLMTPLYDMGALPDCQLLCKASDGALMQYRYALGRAIVFGDGFVHATETGVAPRTLAFLCFTFGDRRMTPAQWANAETYIEAQSPIYQTPAGKLVQSRLASVRGKAAL